MVNYAGLKRALAEEEGAAERCAARLIAIRKRLEGLRARKKDSSLLLATWNIRDFGSQKFNFGPRLPETYYYIAEMISCFDLVAVQEVNRDLSSFDTVMRILGREWDYIVTDTTEGPGGNAERMAFVYNVEKVYFRKIAGEVVLPQGQLVVSRDRMEQDKASSANGDKPETEGASPADSQPAIEPTIKETRQQFARSPFVVAFQSGWFRFSLCTVHIYFGDDRGEKLERRVEEIRKLVHFFADRQDKEAEFSKKKAADPRVPMREAENYILLGDFNVVSPEHQTMQALKSEGFKIPQEIDGSRIDGQGNFYDQIAVRTLEKRFKILGGGVLDMFTDVFRSGEDLDLYERHIAEAEKNQNAEPNNETREARFKRWRTWQMSDHAPLWIEIATDFSDSYLQDIAGGI